MSDSATEDLLQKLNDCYFLLDEIFKKLDSNNINLDYHETINCHLDRVAIHLKCIKGE